MPDREHDEKQPALRRGMYEYDWRATVDSPQVAEPSFEHRAPKKSRWLARWKLVLAGILGGLLVMLAFHASLRSFEANGMSMAPTVVDGDRMLVNRLAYSQVDLGVLDGLPLVDPGSHWQTPQRRDIIVFDSPVFGVILIKRVIGLPGEEVAVRDGAVYVEGERLDEPYARGPTRCRGDCEWIVPAGEYFVMGDNRNGSRDSRQGWTVPLSDIQGERLVGY
jgi:signal peptidase I